MRILHVVGARPNLPKLAPVFHCARAHGIAQVVVNTGQHYDDALFGSLLRAFELPEPDVALDVGSHSHAVQTARVMERLEPVMLRERPDWVVVYGDVNSTLAAALVAAKLCFPVAHVEAGVRSHDRRMPEEVNRIVTDRLSDLLFAPSRSAVEQLAAEGVPARQVVFVGNVMVDTALNSGVVPAIGERTGPVLVTLHRPSNVDDADRLAAILRALDDVAATRAVRFPVHPRTRERMFAAGLSAGRVELVDPLPYHDMLRALANAPVVITDSGGVQIEAAAMGAPCVTLRDTTEWPETIETGGNRLVPDPGALRSAVASAMSSPAARRPDGWDGHASDRIIDALLAAIPSR